ncbi:MAG: O-antigen ligase family protein [Chloroflexota bacterium]
MFSDSALSNPESLTADQVEFKNRLVFLRNYALAMIAALGSIYYLLTVSEEWSSLWWFAFLAIIIALFVNPRFGVYSMLFCGLVGDAVVSYYLPFDKNFSSAESIFYMSDDLKINPIEFLLVITMISWLIRIFMRKEIAKIDIRGTVWPGMIFISIVGISLVTSVIGGGTARIAIWESRYIFYLFLMLVLVTHTVKTPGQIRTIIWLIITAIFIEGILGYLYVQSFDGLYLDEDLTEHSASIHYNAVFILIPIAWVLPKGGWWYRLFLPLLTPPILYTWFVSDRRSAMLALVICIGLLVFYLWQERRLLFYLITPTAAVIGLLYLGAFWNNTSTLGKPAQTIKTVIAPEQTNEKDQSSNFYRVLENFNIMYTIRERPLFGIGFGAPFYQPLPMPDISFFEFWRYITHNSIMWIWMKTGVLGWLAMIFMIGNAINLGAKTAWQMQNGEMRTIAIMSTMYLIMHFLFAYVDISWTSQSMLLVGTAMGFINIFTHHFPKKPEFAAA